MNKQTKINNAQKEGWIEIGGKWISNEDWENGLLSGRFVMNYDQITNSVTYEEANLSRGNSQVSTPTPQNTLRNKLTQNIVMD